jgi:hypothetical protein
MRVREKSNEIKKTKYHGETESGWISREKQEPRKVRTRWWVYGAKEAN